MSSTPVADKVQPETISQPDVGYILPPPDNREGDRLDTQHDLFKLTFGGRLFFSPVNNPQTVLDVGCGTGVWPIDVAKMFPDAKVTGIDLTEQQSSQKPHNYHFMVQNFESDWPFRANEFDLIHNRLIFIAMKNHRKYIEQSFKALKAGGWMEIHEFDFPFSSCSGSLEKWSHYMVQGFNKMGMDPSAALRCDGWLVDAGFVNIHHQIFIWPLSSWPHDPHLKRVGEIAQRNICNGLEGFSMTTFTRVLGWSKADLDKFVGEIRHDMMQREHRWCMRVHVVYGQKP